MASYFKVMQDGREVEFSFYLNNLVVRVPYTNGYSTYIFNIQIDTEKSAFNARPYSELQIECTWHSSSGNVVYHTLKFPADAEESEFYSIPEEDRPTTLTDAVTIISITPSFDNVYYYRI